MANEYIRKDYAGAAAATSLTASVNNSATSLTVADGSTYPTGPTPFVIVVDRGLATEEKMLVGSRSGSTFTITERAYDGTTAQSHSSGAIVEHCLDAYTVYQANRLANLQTTKGDLIAYSGTTTNRLEVGANNAVLVADSAATNGIKWATSLAGLTLTSPVIAAIVNSGTLSLPTSTDTLVGRATTDTLTNKTLSAGTVTSGTITSSRVDQLREKWNISATAATGAITLNAKTASIWYYNADASGNWTLNITGDGSTLLRDIVTTVGDSITVVFAVKNGSTTARWQTALTIDTIAITPLWQGGTAPSSGNLSSTDVYTFVCVRTGTSSPHFTVFASQTRFA